MASESMEEKSVFRPHEFAKLAGVSVKTLQRWDNAGTFRAYRMPSGRRYYTQAHLDELGKTRPSITKNEGDAV